MTKDRGARPVRLVAEAGEGGAVKHQPDDDIFPGCPILCFRCSASLGRALTFRTFVGLVRDPISPPEGTAVRRCEPCGWTNLFLLPS